MKNVIKPVAALLFSLLILSACENPFFEKLLEKEPSNNADILSFSFASPAVNGVINGTNITIWVPYSEWVNIVSLTPIITVSEGAEISPASGIVQDFTVPVSYTVRSRNGALKTYTVTSGVAVDVAADFQAAAADTDIKNILITGDITTTASVTLTAAQKVTVQNGKTLTIGAAFYSSASKITLEGSARISVETMAAVTLKDRLSFGTDITLASSPAFEITNSGYTLSAGTATIVSVTVPAGFTFIVPTGSTLNAPGTTLKGETGSVLLIEGTVTGLAGIGTYNWDTAADKWVKTVQPATVAELNAALASGGPVSVTLNAAFYNDANSTGTPLMIGAASADRPASAPVTITGDSGIPLNVGMNIANDNITIRNVNFNITDSTHAALAYWSASTYYAALFVNRFDDSNSRETGNNAVNNNIVIENCTITFTGTTGFTAGIFVTGNADTAQTGGIIIRNNTVSVTGVGGSAAQALLINRYDPTIKITSNRLSAFNTRTINARAAPASAIHLTLNTNWTTGVNPVISGNTLTGTFSFYVNILAPNRSGLGDLCTDDFATVNSTWVTANTDTSIYAKVVRALIGQSGGAGFGNAELYLNATATDCVVEQYEITNNAVTHINYWGYGITSGAYNFSPDVYGRITAAGATDGVWHWTRSVVDSDGNPNTNN
jgi:hypothetical protein